MTDGKFVPTMTIVSPPAGLRPVLGVIESTVKVTVVGVIKVSIASRPFGAVTSGSQVPANSGYSSVQSICSVVAEETMQAVYPI